MKWVNAHGIDQIHSREMDLWERLRHGLQEINRLTIYCATTRENQNPVLSVNIQGFDKGDV